VPTEAATVTAKPVLVPTPAAAMQITDESDFHKLLAHAVEPTWAVVE